MTEKLELSLQKLMMPELRRIVDSSLNGDGLFVPRHEIVDVSKLTDEQVLELWKVIARSMEREDD